MKRFLLISITLFALADVLQAQANKATPPPLPTGPLIVKPPTDSRTVITVSGPAKTGSSGQASGPKVTVLSRITIIQSGGTSLEESTAANGKKSQIWQTGSYQVTFDPASKDTTVFPQGNTSILATNATSNYPGFGWVSAKNFVAIEKIQGKDCIVFRDPSEEAVAYVDLSSRLPVAAKQVDFTYAYEFSAAATGPITLPPEVQKAISDYKEHQEVGARRAAKPY